MGKAVWHFALLFVLCIIPISLALSSRDQQSVLSVLNRQRTTKNFVEVEWNERVSEHAQKLTDSCASSQPNVRNTTNFIYVRGSAILSADALLSTHSISVGEAASRTVGCGSSVCGEDRIVACVFEKKEVNTKRSDCFTATAYMGCYENDASAPVIPLFSEDLAGTQDADACACLCGAAGYQYSGVAYFSLYCYCGDSFDQDTPTSADMCSACDQNPEQFCGSFFDDTYVSIYKTSIGCNPACSSSQDCSSLTDESGNPFYWCTPSCDFTATVDAPSPCGATATVTINAVGGSTYNTKFDYRVNGGTWVTAPLNTPVQLTYAPGVDLQFDFRNILGCEQSINVSIPASTIPNTNAAPQLVFDVASMQLRIQFFHLLFPSATGQVPLSSYTIEHAYKCEGDSSPLSWTSANTLPSAEELRIPFEYNLQYHARVRATNCVGTSAWSEITTALAPASPYEPIIHEIVPSIPTTGATITVYAENLLGTPSLLIDGVACASQSATSSQITCSLGAGAGTHTATIETSFNHACQKLVSEAAQLSYAAPTITSTSILSNRGGVLTVSGDNFGPVGSPVVVTIDDIACGNCAVSAGGHVEVHCTGCPAGTGTLHNLVVSVSSVQSDVKPFSYAVCSPICVFGACVDTDVCACDEGYGGEDCSQVHICGPSPAFADTSACGDCDEGGVCCVLH